MCRTRVVIKRVNRILEVCAKLCFIFFVALVKRNFNERCMIFIQTKLQAHRMHIVLGLLGVNVGEIHGNLSQMQVGD